jgi:hypothetical protein
MTDKKRKTTDKGKAVNPNREVKSPKKKPTGTKSASTAENANVSDFPGFITDYPYLLFFFFYLSC